MISRLFTYMAIYTHTREKCLKVLKFLESDITPNIYQLKRQLYILTDLFSATRIKQTAENANNTNAACTKRLILILRINYENAAHQRFRNAAAHKIPL